MATIGNGFLATPVFSDSVFVSGVYSGRRREPSHRARVPSSSAIRMSLEDESIATNPTYSLDVQKGLFTHCIEGSGFVLEELIYAHRKLQNLIVVEVRVRNSQDKALKIRLSKTPSNKSEDLDFREVPKTQLPSDISNIEAQYGFINTTEEARSERVGVAVVCSKVPESLVIQPHTNETFYFVTAIVSSLNTVGYLESAFDCYKQAMMLAKADGLLGSHTEAWAELWQQSGIEIEGDLKLAQAVHGSLYYILR
jgi:trehalose/maltose hydrolase-like predicted phosphorylase